ncbi:imidazole glycerol phosphate synthase subunit HisH [Ruicaihuangia caeni]|uniref:Imidazole glycerol phosphate synthase subunit HisH n=1 Tax=Ruicaihuangia caeni TaxID=3042517 RepID=A0AAW6T6F3_9MICO|nr:imidazole glycerol phosphate synthase subunit HisH [Klugiella sp. YN-L-19]MDI2099411.1 imidazole glycerol phosphate synthase subunit HisH [Klugiella sp. YN-L-19]
MTVSIVDYGLGNLGSVFNMLRRIGEDARIVSEPSELAASERLLLPGVGAFDVGVDRLERTGFADGVREFAASGKPLLGICLGMQLLFERSEEGGARGLGLMAGGSRRFAAGPSLRIPHMGWNSIIPVREDPLLKGVEDDNRFYFVHSYHVVPDDPAHVLAESDYGGRFVAMVRHDNVAGAQFHPEKSHAFGMTVLRNFAQQ